MILHPVLAIRCQRDVLLHHIAPMGLAAARGTALLIDLDDDAPGYPGKLTLAELIREGARRRDLGPTERGVALLSRGGAELDAAFEFVDVLAGGWPAVVVRIGADAGPFPLIEAVPDLPSGWHEERSSMVLQSIGRWADSAAEGDVRLPPLSRSQVRSMLAGRVHPRWRWVRAWRPVWELPWD